MYVAAPVFMVAGVALFAPVKRLFENRVGDFLGWISFPLYLVQAAVIYSFSVRGLDVLASFGFEPSMQRWLVGIATVPFACFLRRPVLSGQRLRGDAIAPVRVRALW